MSLRRAGSRFVKNLKTNAIADFYNCVKWPLMTFRYFCLFPISLEKQNINSFSFKWTSPYMIFITIPVLILQCILFGFYLLGFIKSGLVYPITSLTINYACGSISTLFLLKLAKDFRPMFKKIQAIERKLPPIRRNSLVVRLIPVLVIVGCLGSLIQCILNVVFLNHLVGNCTLLDGHSLLKTYFIHIFGVIFQYVEFNYVSAIIFQVLKFQNVFIPTLNDIFVIACSVYLENRFNNLNDIIREEQKMKNGAVYTDWCKIQEHYVQLTKLVRVIDKKINPIVFIAFVIDLFNSCWEFYFVITETNLSYFAGHTTCVTNSSGDLQTKFYKPFTAFFVLFKTVSVSLICARLYTSSREPLNGLHTITQAAYNYDTHRFMKQVHHSNIALSGYEFFYITKEMILTVLSILVTYELVLLQL